jgi:hypothetical protein
MKVTAESSSEEWVYSLRLFEGSEGGIQAGCVWGVRGREWFILRGFVR